MIQFERGKDKRKRISKIVTDREVKTILECDMCEDSSLKSLHEKISYVIHYDS